MESGLSRSSSNASNSSRLRRTQTVRYNPRTRRTTSSGGRLSPPNTPRANFEPPPYVPAVDDQWSLNLLPPEERGVYYVHPRSPETAPHVQRPAGYVAPASIFLDHHKAPKKTSFGVSSLLTAARGKRYAAPASASCLRCTEQFAFPRSKLPRRASLKTTTAPPLHVQSSHGYVHPSHAWLSWTRHNHGLNVQKADGYVPVPTRWLRHNRPRAGRAVRSNGADDHAYMTVSSVMCGPAQIVRPVSDSPLSVKEPSQYANMILPNIDSQMDTQSTAEAVPARKTSLNRRRSMESMHLSFKNSEVLPTEGSTSTSARLPQEIRLRRPSGQPRKNLPPIGSILKTERTNRSSLPTARRSSLANADIPMKSEIAYEAVTHTAVHIFETVPAHAQTEMPATANEGDKTHSATLQVVRSRNSVYEVIWEDKLSAKTVKTSEPTKLHPSEAEALSSVAAWSQDSSSVAKEFETTQKVVQVDTKLAAWSWGVDQESAYHFRASNNEPSTSPPASAHTNHSRAISTRSRPDPAIDTSDLPCRTPEFPDEDTASPSSSSSEPILDNTLERKRRSSAAAKSSSATSDPSLGRQKPTLTASQRRELLGNRKLSNLPPENEHFHAHKDSLVLAHQRMFLGDVSEGKGKARAVEHEDRVSALKKAVPSVKGVRERGVRHGGHGEAED